MNRPAVFLDRDGTLNVRPAEHEYVTTLGEFVWLAGARVGIARLAAAGYAVAVVSNQRGIARRLVKPALLDQLEKRMQDDLAQYGCAIDAFRYCPHDVADACACRKPEPGMLLALAEELDLDLSRSWMIGDAESDVLAGQAAGCRTALIGEPRGNVLPDLAAPSLAEASRRITSSTNEPAASSL